MPNARAHRGRLRLCKDWGGFVNTTPHKKYQACSDRESPLCLQSFSAFPQPVAHRAAAHSPTDSLQTVDIAAEA